MFAMIVAAGKGERLGEPKALLPLGRRTALERCLDAFLAAGPWEGLVVVCREEDLEKIRSLPLPSGIILTPGGTRRQDSVLAGLHALGVRHGRVLVHDVARPFVTPTLIRRVREAPGMAVAAAVPVDDTLRRRIGERVETISREGVVRVQTPQGFDVGALLERLERADALLTDEASLFEEEGVVLVEGDPRNVKITRQADLELAHALIAPEGLRVGHGYDIHPTVLGGPMRLGGVDIPSDVGLAGHSDADVLLHAVADALLGAAGEADIGSFFPPGEVRTAGMDSGEIVRFAVARLAQEGFEPRQVDVTVAATAPKVAPYRRAIRDRLAELLGVSMLQVNVKATTEEGLGEVGRGLGVRAWAIAVIAPTAGGSQGCTPSSA